MALTRDGAHLYVLDQGSFQLLVIDTARIATGADEEGRVLEPDNFPAVVASTATGRYPIAYRRADPRWRRLTGGVDFASPDAEEVSLRSAILQSEGIPHKLRRRSP
jgi:hypothetical protein